MWSLSTGELQWNKALLCVWKGGLLTQVIGKDMYDYILLDIPEQLPSCLTLTVLVTTIDALRHFETG